MEDNGGFYDFLNADISRILGYQYPKFSKEPSRLWGPLMQALSEMLRAHGKENIIHDVYLDIIPGMLKEVFGPGKKCEDDTIKRLIEIRLNEGNKGRVDQIAVNNASPSDIVHKTLECLLFNKVAAGVGEEEPSLEIGAGEGFTSSVIFRGRKITVGTDPIASDIIAAKQFGAHRMVATADALDLPFKNETFRTVYSVHAIDHVPDQKKFVTEAARVLMPGGHLMLTDFSQYFWKLNPLISTLRTMGLDDYADDFIKQHMGDRNFSYMGGTPEWYGGLLEELGFEDINIQYFMCDELGFASEIFRSFYFTFNSLGETNRIMQGDPGRRDVFYDFILNFYPGMIEEDEDVCRERNRGFHLFVHAKKKGGPAVNVADAEEYVKKRIICSSCKAGINTDKKVWKCGSCGIIFPEILSARILMTGQAEYYHWLKKNGRRDIKDTLKTAAKYMLFRAGFRRQL